MNEYEGLDYFDYIQQFAKHNSMTQSFEEWIRGSGIDQNFGFLYPSNYVPIYFKKQPIDIIMADIYEKIKNKALCSEVEKMEDIQLLQPDSDQNPQNGKNSQLVRDYFLVHGMLNKILASYLLQKMNENIPDDEIVIPKHLGVPLYKVSKYLKMKFGIATDFYFNWKLPQPYNSSNLPNDFTVDQVRMIEHFSPFQVEEDLFFGGSVVGSHYLFKAIKILYQINSNIITVPFETVEENVAMLHQVKGFMSKIVNCMEYILSNVEGKLFTPEFKKCLAGFKNLKFEGVEERLSSSGGAGGYDPMFQLFELLMGIEYEGYFKTSQQIFQEAFPETLRKLLQHCEDRFLIKEYSECKEEIKAAYNDIVARYKDIYFVHKQIIHKFVLKKNPTQVHGAAQINIKEVTQRYASISEKMLK